MKRFYEQVAVSENAAGFALTLDGKPLLTPAKAALNLPNAALANALAEEWRAQEGTVSPEDMPLTRLANSAIDRVSPARAQIIDGTAAYGASDLLCYRATEPPELTAAQASSWDRYVEWAGGRFGVAPVVTSGVLPVEQPEELKDALRSVVAEYDDFALAGLNSATALTGSLMIALAVSEGFAGAQDAWEAAQVDEAFQVSHWGIDDEALERSEANRIAFLDATRFVALVRS